VAVEDVRAVGLSGESTEAVGADGSVTWTVTTDGASLTVKWKDPNIEDQVHPPLKAGSKVKKLANGGYSIEERT
jgi:hypothetical protein